jgi:hypothetical protein
MAMAEHSDLYRQEDAQQILHIAIARQTEAGDLSRLQLLEIAEELNIDPSDIEAAEIEWRSRQSVSADRLAFNQDRWQGYQRKSIRYAVVNGVMLWLTFSFWVYIAIIWGSALGLKGLRMYLLRGDDYDRALQKWRRKRQLKKSVDSWINRWLGV